MMKNRKIPNEDKRIFEVKIRLNRKEKDKLDQAMTTCQTHGPDIFRRLLMKNKFPEAKPPILDVLTYDQLRRIGVNLNQYVKAINQKKLTEMDPLIMEELTTLIRIIRTKIVTK